MDKLSIVAMAPQSGAITNAALRFEVKKNPVDLAFPVARRSPPRVC